MLPRRTITTVTFKAGCWSLQNSSPTIVLVHLAWNDNNNPNSFPLNTHNVPELHLRSSLQLAKHRIPQSSNINNITRQFLIKRGKVTWVWSRQWQEVLKRGTQRYCVLMSLDETKRKYGCQHLPMLTFCSVVIFQAVSAIVSRSAVAKRAAFPS